MAVIVFDADVLIGFLGSDDPHHTAAVERVRRSFVAGSRRLLSAVNYTEVLIGPLRGAGAAGAGLVDGMLGHFGIETVAVETRLARRAAAVRAETNLKLPDAYAIATALDARSRDDAVRLESFDERVLRAYAKLAGT